MTERNYSIDFIRLVAILAVIVIHTSTYFLDRTPNFSFNFYVLYIINQLFRFAVPAFFAISGFLLASHYKDISPLVFYKKRFSKILLPYFVWSLIYFLIIFPNPINSASGRIFFYDLLTGDASYQLYFIPAIILLYAIFPLILRYKKILLTGWFTFLLFGAATVILSYFYFTDTTPQIISPVVVGFYNLLPFLIGIYAAINIDDLHRFIKKRLTAINIITAVSLIFVFFESLFMFKKTGHAMYLRNQWRITVTIYGAAFVSLLYVHYRKNWDKITRYLSSFSFGVFFVHVAILHNILRVFYAYKLYDLGSFVLSLTLTVVLSFLFSIILSKISIVNKLLGLRA